MRISVSPPASVSVTTSFTMRPMRADDDAPSTPTALARQVLRLQQPGARRIVDVVVDVGDEVGDAHDLPFERARAHAPAAMPTGAPDFPFECFAMPSRTSQVRFRPAAVVLEHVDDAQALLVVVEPARHQRVEDALAGVAERRVPEVVAERDGLGQLLVQPQHLGDGPGDLRHLERVRQAGAVVVAGRREEHLRLVLQPAERLAVDDAIAVALKRRPDVVFGLRRAGGPATRRSWRPAARGSRARALELLADRHGRVADRRTAAISSRKLVPCAQRADAEHARPASAPDRRTSRACRGRRRPGRAAPATQQRHVLARVIGARRRRIVAVVGGDDEQVVVAQPRQQRRQPRVEPLEVARRSPPRRCDGRTACRSRRGWRTSARARRRAICRSTASMPSSSLAV